MSSIFRDFFNLDNDKRKLGQIEYKNVKPAPAAGDYLKLKANIYGRVQGVGFRFTTKHLADQLGVSGIVRNESDGSVYAEAVGSTEQLEEFIAGLAKGPSPNAIVDKVIIEYDDSIPDYKGFGERY